MIRVITVIMLWLYTAVCFAVTFKSRREPTGVGGVANSMMDPVTLFSDIVYTGCIVIGAAFVFASLIRYIEHRRNPLMVNMSTVVFLLIAGIVLLLLPFLSYVDSSALRYSFFS